MIWVVFGVSGVGKTTVGSQLAAEWELPFFDADDFHPAENVEKMSAGVPLTDEDRWPWLDRLADLMRTHAEKGLVLACSALKIEYRDRLRVDPAVRFVFLSASFDDIADQMSTRVGHYMKPEMLESQFEALERPTPAEGDIFFVNAYRPIAEIEAEIRAQRSQT